MPALPVDSAIQGADLPLPLSQNYFDATHAEHGVNGVSPQDVVAAAAPGSLNNGDALADVPACAIAMRDNFNENINAVRDTLNNRIDNVRDDLVHRLEGLSQKIHTIQAIAARSYNASIPIAIPPHVVYEVVPFRNGDDPTLPPHSLPPLRTKEDLEGLSHAQLRGYLRGYNLAIAEETDRRSLARYLRITL